MIKKTEITINNQQGRVYITDEPEKAGELIAQKEAVIFVCEDIMNAPFVSGCRYMVESVEQCDMKYINTVYARYKGIPLMILETERTYVKEISVEMLPYLYEIYDDDLVREFMEPLYEYEEEKKFTECYIENMYGFYGYGLWLVYDKEKNELIGRAGISIRNIDGEDRNELGYMIRREYRNKGYCTEVCTGIKEYAFNELDIEKLYIVTENRNIISKKVADRLGFAPLCLSAKDGCEYMIFQCKK